MAIQLLFYWMLLPAFLQKIIECQLDSRFEQFMEEELDTVLKRTKSRKAAGVNEISPEIWKTRKFDDILL